MPFPPEALLREEEIALDVRPHWWTLVAPTAFVSGVAIAAILIQFFVSGGTRTAVSGVFVLVLFVALINLLFCYLRWTTTNFVVTNQRIIYRHGIIAKHLKEIPLDRVTNIAFNQTVFERIIGSGDLKIESAGETGQETFHDMRRPGIVHNEIYKQMEDEEVRSAKRNAEIAGRATGEAEDDSIPAQISKLDELRQRGLLSDEEFENKKRDLLNRM